MPARRSLLVCLGLATALVAAMLTWPGRTPAPPKDGAPSLPSTTPADRIAATAAATADDARAPTDDSTAPADRALVNAGNGWLYVHPALGPLPMANGGVPANSAWIAMRAEPADDEPGERSPVDLEWIEGEGLGAELASGSWRIRCIHGPGDPPGTTVSRAWVVDPDDVVGVPAGGAARVVARIVRSSEGDAEGRSTIVGVAFVDGRPATEHVVLVVPLADAAIARVRPDGSFRIDDAPAGWHELQLWSRSRRGPMLFARSAIAPRDGEVLRVEIRGETSGIDGVIVDPDGRPVDGAQVELWRDEAHVVAGTLSQTRRHAWSDADGHFSFTGLPLGGYRVQGSDGDGETGVESVSAIADTISSVRIVRSPWVSVRGTIEWADATDRPPWPVVEILLDGPVRKRLRCQDGRFAVSWLLAGTYRVSALTMRGRLPAESPLVVPSHGLDDARITIRHRR